MYSLDSLEGRNLFSVGININDTSTRAMTLAIPVLKSMHITDIRLYNTINFNNKSLSGTLKRAIEYHNRGFRVALTINNSKANSVQITNWLSWAMRTPLRDSIDYWQIGNEPDHKRFWSGSLQSYVNSFLKPSYKVLHRFGEKVISAGPSWNPKDIRTMVKYGLLSNCDYVGYHPYSTSLSLMNNRILEVKRYIGGKPLVASEWNVRGISNKANWAKAVKQFRPSIESQFAINYYYATFVSSTMAGPAGILTKNGARTIFSQSLI
jgi:hypothetical protein